MDSLASLMSTGMLCGTVLTIAFLILMALPQSKLRSVGMEIGKWIMAALCAILVISPIDIIPDVIPVLGWGDDIGYVVAAVAAARSAWKERQERQLMEE